MGVVSSGAVGGGCLKLKLQKRPKELAARQARAAVGQLQLMRYYEDFLTALGLVSLTMAACTAAAVCPHLTSRGRTMQCTVRALRCQVAFDLVLCGKLLVTAHVRLGKPC